MKEKSFERPVWDRGEPIDERMLAFTTGDDPLMDRRLVEHDLIGSLAHASGLLEAKLLSRACSSSARSSSSARAWAPIQSASVDGMPRRRCV